MVNEAFVAALNDFVTASAAMCAADMTAKFPNSPFPPAQFSYMMGPRYVRVVKTDGSSRSVYCFVRIEDGAILKAAGWKAPFIAKGGPHCPQTVRGSIYHKQGQDAVNWHGARYVR